MGDRYRFASTRLSAEENRILAAGISRNAAVSLAGNEVFEFYQGDGRERRRFLKKRKRAKEPESMATPQEPLAEESGAHLRMEVSRAISESDEDEMLRAMDKFWAADGKSTACMEEGGGTELMAMLAGYLDTIDT